ncbi:acyltransferase [Burkholderia plantarii]|nr:acyltransferase [Burkholderia plantarii]
MPTPRKGKIDFLKGLRGAGAMAVMAGHPIGAFFPAAAFGTPDNVHAAADLPSYNLPVLHVFFDGGFAGYVLTLNPARWKTSAIKRFPRLMIPAFASVMLAYLVIKSGLVFNPAAAPPSKSIWLGYFYKQPADFLSALHEALIGAVLPGHATYNSSLWTMAFEFYGAPLCLALAVMCEPLRRGKTAVYVLRHSRRSMLADRRNQPAADR